MVCLTSKKRYLNLQDSRKLSSGTNTDLNQALWGFNKNDVKLFVTYSVEIFLAFLVLLFLQKIFSGMNSDQIKKVDNARPLFLSKLKKISYFQVTTRVHVHTYSETTQLFVSIVQVVA